MGQPHPVEEPLDLAHEVGELTREASDLKEQVRMLRLALDEFHTDFMWAVQNTRIEPSFQVTSLRLEPSMVDSCEEIKDDAVPETPLTTDRNDSAAIDQAQADELPELTLARVEAIEQFRKYLDEAGHSYRAPQKEEVERLDETVALLPDFLVSRPAEPLLLTVRRTLSESERADMAKWQRAFGSQFQAAQVWGRQGKHGVSWGTEVIVDRDKDSTGLDAEAATDEKTNSNAESKPAVGGPCPPENSIRRTNQRRAAQPTQPLYMRIMQLHMTDIVRAIGYEELPQKDAYRRLVPLMEKYGKGKIETAAKELIETVPDRRGLYRLSAAARPFAIQLLGRPAERKPAEALNSQTLPTETEASRRKESGVEVKLPRDKVIKNFKAWLTETNRTFIPLAAETIQGLKVCCVLLPDGVVDGTELVTVRQVLSERQRGDMKAWLTLMGEKFEAVRTWPTSRGEGNWNWMWEVVAGLDNEAEETLGQ